MDEVQRERRKASVRLALLETKGQIERTREDRDALIIEGVELGIPKTELADLAGVARDTIYNVLNRTVEN